MYNTKCKLQSAQQLQFISCFLSLILRFIIVVLSKIVIDVIGNPKSVNHLSTVTVERFCCLIFLHLRGVLCLFVCILYLWTFL